MPSSSLFGDAWNSGWKARLELGFVEKNHKTIIQDRKHFGPLQIQKPFYPEPNGRCHVYILHPPGGVVGGDRFEIEIHVASHAKALITTPAAGKFYRSSGPVACQKQNIKVAPQGVLEWFPSENIFFSGAKAKLRTKVDLMGGSYFFGWDICCLGRPASGEQFFHGALDQRFEIWLDKKPIRLERFKLNENDPILKAKWGLGNQPVFGNFVCLTSKKDLVNLLRKKIPAPENGNAFSTTFIDGIILCRYLGNSVEQAKGLFMKTWDTLRLELFGQRAVIPRIWNT